MTRSATGNRFRTRKLSTKQSLAVLRENQIDFVEDDSQRNIPQIETGVERQEEIEHHLQAVISAHQAAAIGSKDTKKVFIPTPNTNELSNEEYSKLYPERYRQPHTYIKSSHTVEDCSGTLYCMSEADDVYLAKLNASRKPTLPPITEDEFESIVELYENAIQVTQPYLSMDVANIIPFEELEHAFENILDSNLRAAAKQIYPYWKEQKINRDGQSIIPSLKFEQGNEKDDGDPYVCFRRREVRQIRKTRRGDNYTTDKLKKLRQDIELARGLVKDVLQREHMRRTTFQEEAKIFELRRTAVELKRKLNIKDTDEDLISKPKRQRTEAAAPPTLRIPMRQDGKPPDADLRQLSAVQAEDEKRRIEQYNRLRSLQRAFSKYPMVDATTEVVLQAPDRADSLPGNYFCAAQTYFLPSPPQSADSVPSASPESDPSLPRPVQVSIVQAPSSKMQHLRGLPTYRRRVGRGGRIFIDRRRPHGNVSIQNLAPEIQDRMKFDLMDMGEDEQNPAIYVDPFSDEQIRFCAKLLSPPPESPILQTPNAIRHPTMASSSIVTASGPESSPASMLHMTHGHHAVPAHHPMMTPNAMQVNGHSQTPFPVRR